MVTVGSPGIVGCAASNVVGANLSGSVVIGARATTSVTFPSRMIVNAPHGCQDAVFPLIFGGSAVHP